jgi:hypothetical protein
MFPRPLASIALPFALLFQAPLTNRFELFEITARTSNGPHRE